MSRPLTPVERLSENRWYGETRRSLRLTGAVLTDLHHPTARRLPRHGHERSFFSLLVAGSYAERERGGRVCGHAPGTLLYQPAALEHADEIGTGGARFFTVELAPERLFDLLGDGTFPREPRAARSGPLVQAAARLRREALAATQADPQAIEQALQELLAKLVAPRAAASVPTRRPRWLGAVEEHLRARFRDRTITLADVARDVGVHPVHLSRTFRRHLGIAPLDRIHQYRVRWAWERLSDPEAAISRVAAEAGFVDSSHMTRMFRRWTGETPGRLRERRHRGETA